MGELFSLDNPIQNYAWGSHTTLAVMRGTQAPTEQPEAELWVGAHPSAPSIAHVDGGAFPLDALVGEQPARFLNPERTSDTFPFLFKVLAIESPLSIQVHPTAEQAQAGFEDENARGVALDDPARNYKDRFSKPETVIALSEMRILTGVREFPELRAIAEHFSLPWLTGALGAAKTAKGLLTVIIRMSQDAAAAAAEQTVAAARAWVAKNGEVPGAESTAAGVAELVTLLDSKYPGDRGLLVALVMNLLYLAPGDSAHTPDGQIHAYISGTAIELMNPSDNVMRAGLTPKHIDTEELITTLSERQEAPIIRHPTPVSGQATEYSMWDKRLSVTHLTVAGGEKVTLPLTGVATALCTGGTVVISDELKTFTLTGTQSVMYVGDPTEVTVTGAGELFIAAQR
ncbi:mannose-6-phosphate isomerase, class I [Rothia nasimurium]|uniref:mannose-6-phosphate isomerase n=1 Tax=Rothia nasimurium TaxID=85336 RepID=A0A1Y1RQ87_9MICC|nr:mannose-6-phosphate isomerase, class I [Rothia nasimurium]ORC20647.1 mannose-6-phosphate isomerase, class I [Rothia nasimurium]